MNVKVASYPQAQWSSTPENCSPARSTTTNEMTSLLGGLITDKKFMQWSLDTKVFRAIAQGRAFTANHPQKRRGGGSRYFAL